MVALCPAKGEPLRALVGVAARACGDCPDAAGAGVGEGEWTADGDPLPEGTEGAEGPEGATTVGLTLPDPPLDPDAVPEPGAATCEGDPARAGAEGEPIPEGEPSFGGPFFFPPAPAPALEVAVAVAPSPPPPPPALAAPPGLATAPDPGRPAFPPALPVCLALKTALPTR